jgi:hypothetical protein
VLKNGTFRTALKSGKDGKRAAFASNLRLSAQEKWAGIDNAISSWTLAPSVLVYSAVAVATGNQ